MSSTPCPEKYLYLPLTGGLNDATDVFTIRLLHLLPSTNPQSPLHCHLIETSIPVSTDTNTHPTQYHALSYTWGEPVFPASLAVVEREGQDERAPQVGVINITENLHSALENLRKSDETLIIWADAVCINQADTAERNSQVTNMPDIYRQAASVIVWLGRDSKDRGHGTQAIHFLQDLATLVDNPKRTPYKSSVGQHRELFSLQLKSWRGRLVINKVVTSFLKGSGLDHLQWFLDRPWFRRRWIIQEVVLARTVMVHCGSCSIPWDTLDVAMSELSANGMGPLTKSNRTNMHTITKMRSFERSLAAENPLEVLVRFAHFDCADPRDRLYALYGVMRRRTALREQIRSIDYTLSTADLYLKFSIIASCMASKDGIAPEYLFQVLQVASSFRSHSLESKPEGGNGQAVWQAMPSWVVDWTGSPRFQILFAPAWDCFQHPGVHVLQFDDRSCSRARPAIRTLLNTNVLFWAGVIVDAVTAIIPLNIEPLLDTGNGYLAKQELNDVLYDFTQRVHSTAFESEGDGNLYAQGGVAEELTGRDHLVTAIAVSLVANWNLTPRNSYFDQDPRFREDFKTQLRNSEHHLPDILHKWPAYVELVALTMRGRSLIMTARGYIGIAASDTDVGDLVCLPVGSTLPFVFRPQNKPAELGDGAVNCPNAVKVRESFSEAVLQFEKDPTAHAAFQLVSDAYLHGLYHDPLIYPFSIRTTSHAGREPVLLPII